MATAPVIDAPGTALATTNDAAAIVLFDDVKFDAFYAKLKADVEAVPVDLKTDKGRKAIASAAAKVRSEKASIDRDRKRLTQEWRDMTAQVNGAWKGIEARLDELAVEARKPLTEWEEAEKARAAEIERMIADIHIAAIVAPEDTAATVRNRGTMVWQIRVDAEQFGDRAEEARAARAQAVEVLKAALARLTKEEADRAELARLRAAEAERLSKEQAEREAREAKERAAAEAKAEEERRAAAEKAEAERIERAKREAAELAERNAQRQARIDQEARERAHQEALAAERAKVEAAERAERQRQAEAQRIADEQAAREANEEHRAGIKSKAVNAIVAIGIAERTAVRLVQAICANDIPHVSMRF